MTGKIMKGKSTWVRAMMIPSPLYMSGSGPSIRPQPVSVRLMIPLFPRMIVQP